MTVVTCSKCGSTFIRRAAVAAGRVWNGIACQGWYYDVSIADWCFECRTGIKVTGD
jgi:hypothetical protein